MQLRPREYFTIARGLEDHTDSGTYYVRAVIRNAKTDTLIETVDLTDQGNRRFSKAWQVPADTSGEGFYILVTTTVYTDSAYTTKSGNYGEKFDTFLVQDRVNPNLGVGGAGGPDIDYKKVRSILKEEIGSIPTPKESDVDLRPLTSAIHDLSVKVGTISRPQAVNLKPVLDALDAVKHAIQGIPKPEPIDYTPIIDAAASVAETASQLEASAQRADPFYNNIAKILVEDRSEIEALMKDVKESLNATLTPEKLQAALGTIGKKEEAPTKKHYVL